MTEVKFFILSIASLILSFFFSHFDPSRLEAIWRPGLLESLTLLLILWIPFAIPIVLRRFSRAKNTIWKTITILLSLAATIIWVGLMAGFFIAMGIDAIPKFWILASLLLILSAISFIISTIIGLQTLLRDKSKI